MDSNSNQSVLPIAATVGSNTAVIIDSSSDMLDTSNVKRDLDDGGCASTANNVVEDLLDCFDDSVFSTNQNWIHRVHDSKIKPYPGQRLIDIEFAFSFYTEYGRQGGFDVRKSTHRISNNIIISKYLVCSKAGNLAFPTVHDSDNNSESSMTSSNVNGGVRKKRKTVTKKCDCNAKILLKYVGPNNYAIGCFIEGHNHPLASESGKQFLRSNRNMTVVHRRFVCDVSTSNIGAYRAHSLYKAMSGYADVGATAVDFQNWIRDIKLYIGKHDAEMLIQKFKNKYETSDGGFFYEYESDSDGHLTRIFWANVQGRRRYSTVFVPFVGLDNHWKSVIFASALLNKDVTNFSWACDMFLKVFGLAPKCIITDQCAAMKIAIAEKFPHSLHRYCMWNIMQKFPSKIGIVFCAESDFMKKLGKFVWANHLSPSEFEKGWTDVLKDNGLTDHPWLKEMYDIRESWIPAFFRDKPMVGLLRTTSRSESSNFYFNHFVQKGDTLSEFYMCYESAIERQLHYNKKLNHEDSYVSKPVTEREIEKDAARLYTRTIFYKVQKEIKASCYHIKYASQPCIVDGVNKYILMDKRVEDKVFEVMFSMLSNDVSCSCQLFTRVGYLCRHCFFCLGIWGIEEIPRQYLCNRWLKNAEERFSVLKLGQVQDTSQSQSIKEKSKLVWTQFQGCVSDVSSDAHALDYLLEEMEALRIRVRDKVISALATKDDMLEEMFGVKPSGSISILPSLQSNNKGMRKRIIGGAEKSCDGKKRDLRVCKACNTKAYHDSRNCPKKSQNLFNAQNADHPEAHF